MIYLNSKKTTMGEDKDNERHRELFESPIQPLQINMVHPYADLSDKMFSLQVNGEVLWKKKGHQWKFMHWNGACVDPKKP